ncbi:uncharacterized protein [Euphorbia lathyris]|uniref:uncharacterized protein n=1 Tax=Euphorbia lathyris TaxID=212925 RepID=UPI0033136229
MKGASKVIMGATLVMVITLAIVLTLVLVLLAELYCTLLLRRRQQLRHTGSPPTSGVTTTVTSAPAPTVQRSFTPGVLEAPRSLFYPSKSTLESRKLHNILQIHTQQQQLSNSSPHQHIGLVKTSPTALTPAASEVQIQVNDDEPFVYISNPIYDGNSVVGETPFETPDSSPSRLETGSPGLSSSGEEDEICTKVEGCASSTPPLTPMKKLPAEGSSVSLRDARSLGASGSDSVSNNGLSSSSGSPSTSPSW